MKPSEHPIVFKVLRPSEWDRLLATGEFSGSDDDQRDGYIHLSTRAQLAETLARHFAGDEALVLAEVPVNPIEGTLRWEPSRRGNLFPHLYAPLTTAAISRHWPLSRNANGVHQLPEELELE